MSLQNLLIMSLTGALLTNVSHFCPCLARRAIYIQDLSQTGGLLDPLLMCRQQPPLHPFSSSCFKTQTIAQEPPPEGGPSHHRLPLQPPGHLSHLPIQSKWSWRRNWEPKAEPRNAMYSILSWLTLSNRHCLYALSILWVFYGTSLSSGHIDQYCPWGWYLSIHSLGMIFVNTLGSVSTNIIPRDSIDQNCPQGQPQKIFTGLFGIFFQMADPPPPLPLFGNPLFNKKNWVYSAF